MISPRALFIVLLVFVVKLALAQSLPMDRQLDWQQAGLENTGATYGDIVDPYDFGALPDDSLDDYVPIQAAIDLIPVIGSGPGANSGVVQLRAGVYILTQPLVLPSWVILRGESSASTYLRFDFGGTASHCIEVSGTVSGDYDTLVSGFEAGSAFVDVNDPGAFAIGDHVEIVEDNGAWDTSPAAWANESVGQLTEVVSISGNTVELADEIRLDLDAGLFPRMRTYEPVEGVGIECLKVERVDDVASGAAYMHNFSYARNCWVAGVESRKSVGSHVMISASKHVTVTGCYFYDSWAFNGSQTRGYGVTLTRHSGDCLIENNVFEHLRHAMMVKQGANGNVFAYNYSFDPFRSEPGATFSGDISLHGHYPYGNLFESNIVQNIMTDDYWGPAGPYNTFFRNRVELFGVVMTSDSSNHQNYIGNEIPSVEVLQGNYTLTGVGHFEASNFVQGSIVPDGTAIAESSLYLTEVPSFWQGTGSWPSLGTASGSGTIPARERFVNGIENTYHASANCTAPVNLGAPDQEQLFAVYPNPARNFLYVESAELVTGLQLIDMAGRVVANSRAVMKNGIWDFRAEGAEIPDGLYILQLHFDDLRVQRLLTVYR